MGSWDIRLVVDGLKLYFGFYLLLKIF